MNKRALQEYFDSLAPLRDKWKRANRYYHQEIENLAQFLTPSDSSILEVGCATGDLLARLNPKRGKGVDFSSRMVSIAQQKYPQLHFAAMDVEDLHMSEPYDYVILSDVIGFLFDIQRAFSALHQVCHKKSRLIITSWSHLWEPILKLAEKLGLKTPQPWQSWVSLLDVENLLYLSGFEVIKKGRYLLFPKYIPLFSFLVNRYLARLPLLNNLCLVYYLVARPLPQLSSREEHSVSVIVPARNEAGNIEPLVERLPKVGLHEEIIFVEGHSHDHTLEKMREVQKRFPLRDIKVFVQSGEGKGDAVRKGFEQAHGDVLMILDADLSVAPEELPKFYDVLCEGKGDFVNGSRLVYPMENEAMRLLNLVGNKFFSVLFSWLLDQRIKDTLCGTKVLWQEDYERIRKGRSYFGEFDPFGDFDLLFGAAKLNLKIVDLPIRYMERTYGKSNLRFVKHGWLLLKMCTIATRKIKFF